MSLFSNLAENDIFSGGIGLFLIGALTKLATPALRFSSAEFTRRMTVTREISTNDRLTFQVIAEFISKELPTMENHSSVSFGLSQDPKDNADRENKFNFRPSPGNYFVKYRNTWININRIRNATVAAVPFESITLKCIAEPLPFSKRKLDGNQLLDQLFIDAMSEYQTSINDKIIIYEPKTGTWEPFGQPIKKRSLDSVILDSNQSERILHDMKNFLNSSQWYTDMGISHQRGYLFYGPPGTGKTSYIKALAGSLNFNIAIFNVGSWHMDDHRLMTLMNNVPANTIILFEDIDCCIPSRKSSQSEITGQKETNNSEDPRFAGMQGKISFSGLLNSLDGIVGGESRIICMTTNEDPETFDPALLRPGRCDFREYFGYASDQQIIQIYARFFEAELEQQDLYRFGQEFSSTLRQQMAELHGEDKRHKISPAEVQNILMAQRGCPEFFRAESHAKKEAVSE